LEPLLINTEDSWKDRPDAVTRIPNLFLAADYVRTHTDLATMEGANEAARRAVNGILNAAHSSEQRCHLWPLHEPALFAPARLIDYVRYKLRLPPLGLGQAELQSLLAPPAIRRRRITQTLAQAATLRPQDGPGHVERSLHQNQVPPAKPQGDRSLRKP
jgi:hypothetical protein